MATNDTPSVPNLALRPREAAKSLGVSPRWLWERTKRGDIPHVRVGRAVLYPVDGLRDWLARQAESATAHGKSPAALGGNDDA